MELENLFPWYRPAGCDVVQGNYCGGFMMPDRFHGISGAVAVDGSAGDDTGAPTSPDTGGRLFVSGQQRKAQ